MGRVLIPQRRQAAIDRWRQRFSAAAIGVRPKTPALLSLLALDTATLTNAQHERLADAKRRLWAIHALPESERPAALDTWLAKHLVDTGPHMLLDKKQRNAVLASLRDDDRRKRRRQSTTGHVTLRLPADLVEQLRHYGRSKKLPSAGAALKALLEASHPKPRASARGAVPPCQEDDLFGGDGRRKKQGG